MKQKKYIYFLILTIITNLFLTKQVFAVDLCKTSALETFRIFGMVIFIAKILVPLIIVILGIISFSKIVFSGDDKDFSSSIKNLTKKLIGGVIIFFIPTLVLFVMSFLSDFGTEDVEQQFMICSTCLLDVNSSDCDTYIECTRNPDGAGCEGYGTLDQMVDDAQDDYNDQQEDLDDYIDENDPGQSSGGGNF